MNRTPFVAGNWKMNKTVAEARELVSRMGAPLREIPNVEKVICPPFTSLQLAGNLLKGSAVKVGAQNMSEHDEGAYTGEISWKMLRPVLQIFS